MYPPPVRLVSDGIWDVPHRVARGWTMSSGGAIVGGPLFRGTHQDHPGIDCMTAALGQDERIHFDFGDPGLLLNDAAETHEQFLELLHLRFELLAAPQSQTDARAIDEVSSVGPMQRRKSERPIAKSLCECAAESEEQHWPHLRVEAAADDHFRYGAPEHRLHDHAEKCLRASGLLRSRPGQHRPDVPWLRRRQWRRD